MKDFKKEVIIDGTKYVLVFNINVTADIQEKYGNINDWLEKVKLKEDFKNVDIAALRYGITLMLNEGIEIENENLPESEQKPLLTERQVGRLITNYNTTLSTAATETIEESMEVEENPNV